MTKGVESLYFYIQGDGLCAILHVDIENWTKLEEVRQKKGVGRRSAEFVNLKFDVIKKDHQTKFIYRTYDYMLD